jgi:hypothetical protein
MIAERGPAINGAFLKDLAEAREPKATDPAAGR